MYSEIFKRVIILLTLGLLTISAFFIRLENFKNSKSRSTDEIIYYTMAQQVKKNILNYNSIPYAQILESEGRYIPEYLKRPLFKYPPLFVFMLAQSLKNFGMSLISAAYISILSGALLVPIVYLLGSSIFNRSVGIISAFFLFIDPVSIVCSQKIWLETPLALFSILSVLFFIWGLNQKYAFLFIYSGICCGLATLTKYPGILLICIYFIYAFFYQRHLLRKGLFWLGIFIPFIMLTPWIMWNFEIYGTNFIKSQILLHTTTEHLGQVFGKILLIIGFLGLIAFILLLKKENIRSILSLESYDKNDRLCVVLAIALGIVLITNLIRAFQLTYIPVVGWQIKMFYNEPPTFYLGRLLEFSLIYAFGYLAYFFRESIRNDGRSVIKLATVIYMIFYIFWGNYQSRYILVCIPFLLILSVQILMRIFKYIVKMPLGCKKNIFLFMILMLISFILIKTTYINQILTFSNDFCYF